MGFGEAIRHNFTHYADFSGRAQRSQYWWWVLFVIVVGIVTNVLDLLLGVRLGASTRDVMIGDQVIPLADQGVGLLTLIFFLVVAIPGLAVQVRRLHDTDRTGWWWLWGTLLAILCCIGFIILLVFYLQRGTAGPNRYGADPLEPNGPREQTA